MKKFLAIAFLCSIVITPSVFAQRVAPEPSARRPAGPGPNPGMVEAMQAMQRHERELELREHEMDLEERELELQFHRKMKEMELTKHEAELKMYFAKMGGEMKKGAVKCGEKCGGGKCGSMQKSAGPCGGGKCGGGKCGSMQKATGPCGGGKCGPAKSGDSAGCGKKCKEMMEGLCFIMIIVHILLAVWVFKDIRKRGAGSGIWIVITLLIGVIGAALYLLARIGDAQSQ